MKLHQPLTHHPEGRCRGLLFVLGNLTERSNRLRMVFAFDACAAYATGGACASESGSWWWQGWVGRLIQLWNCSRLIMVFSYDDANGVRMVLWGLNDGLPALSRWAILAFFALWEDVLWGIVHFGLSAIMSDVHHLAVGQNPALPWVFAFVDYEKTWSGFGVWMAIHVWLSCQFIQVWLRHKLQYGPYPYRSPLITLFHSFGCHLTYLPAPGGAAKPWGLWGNCAGSWAAGQLGWSLKVLGGW